MSDNIFLKIIETAAQLRDDTDAAPCLAQKRAPLIHPEVAAWRNNNADLDTIVIMCEGSVSRVAKLIGVSYQIAYVWKNGGHVAPRHTAKIRAIISQQR